MPIDLGAGVRRLLAPNPSPMTHRGTNTYVLGTGPFAVIDPGPDMADHLEAILATTAGAVSHILVTHPHLDHSALAPRLAAVVDAPVLAYGSATEGRSDAMQRLAAAGLSGGGEGLDRRFAPDIRLRTGDRVAGAGWSLETLHCPGHQAGHLCFAADDLLFSGDHLMGWASTLISPPDGDLAAFRRSCEALASRPWRKALPGHGEPVDAPAERLAWLLAHRADRERAILAALKQGAATLDAIVARVYADTPPSLRPAAARNVFAHLVDLVERGAVVGRPELSPSASFAPA